MPSRHNSRGKAEEQRRKELIRSQHTGYRRPGTSKSSHRNGASNTTAGPRGHNVGYRKTYRTEPLDMVLFDFLIVVDFEATCESSNVHYPHEIIEFPAVLIDVRRGIIEREKSFHTYVRPVLNPILSNFCMSLTGIRQAQVDHAPLLQVAVDRFVEWFVETIPLGAKVAFATDGPTDFRTFLHECGVLRDGVHVPTVMYEFIDIRTTFMQLFNSGYRVRKLNHMLSHFGLKFEGKQHNGFDDACNIARIALEMARSGRCTFNYLECITLEKDTLHYAIPGYPIYRSDSGSCELDRDIVEDIAKRCFGKAYFEYGSRAAAEIQRYRLLYPACFSQAMMYPEDDKAFNNARALRRKVAVVAGVVVLFVVLAIAKVWMRRWGLIA